MTAVQLQPNTALPQESPGRPDGIFLISSRTDSSGPRGRVPWSDGVGVKEVLQEVLQEVAGALRAIP